MRINKDLADAIMMVSFIVLVLVGTTTFDNEVTKNVTMGSLGVITVAMLDSSQFNRSRQKEEGRSLLVVSPLVSCCWSRGDPGLSEIRFSTYIIITCCLTWV